MSLLNTFSQRKRQATLDQMPDDPLAPSPGVSSAPLASRAPGAVSPSPAPAPSPSPTPQQYGTPNYFQSNPFHNAPAPAPSPVPTAAPAQAQSAAPTNPFTSGSTYQDLLGQLNSQNAAPGSDAFSSLTNGYVSALGLQGGPGNGFNYGQLDPGRNKVYVPGGYDLKYENGQWNPHAEGPSGPDAGGGYGGGGYGMSSSFSGMDPNDPFTQTVRAKLLELLNGSNGPVTAQDPNISSQSVAYRTARERSANQERTQLAERLAAEGLNSGGQGSGAFDQGVQGIQEQSGQDIASNDANLVGQEVEAKRAQLMQALQLADALGARSESNAIQLQLANLDNQYRYAALGQNQGQFQDRTAYDYANLQAELNRQALLAGLQG